MVAAWVQHSRLRTRPSGGAGVRTARRARRPTRRGAGPAPVLSCRTVPPPCPPPGPRPLLPARRSVLSPCCEKCRTRCRVCRAARCPDGRCGSVQRESPPRPPRQHTTDQSRLPAGAGPSRPVTHGRVADADRTDVQYRYSHSAVRSQYTVPDGTNQWPHGSWSRLRPIVHASKWARFQTWTIRTVM